jgi:hypothetical protein
MLGETELVRLIEDNGYPARLVDSGLVWVELEMIDPNSKAMSRRRLSKSAFADLILDWRERRAQSDRQLSSALRTIGIAA